MEVVPVKMTSPDIRKDEFDGVDDARTNDGDEKSYVKDGNGQIPNGDYTETED